MNNPKTATVADIIDAMEVIAPADIAEDWDNSGLQVGNKDWTVKSILIALDPSVDVIHSACSQKADMLITHHPMIFKPISSVDFSSNIGSLIYQAAINRLTIFSAHTNLDSTVNGVNDVLAEKIGLKSLKPLVIDRNSKEYKLVVYTPEEFEDVILETLLEHSTLKIGDYSSCSFRCKGKGTFNPGMTAAPFSGKKGALNHEIEIRIEALVKKEELFNIIKNLKKKHPYEKMAYDVYKLHTMQEKTGMGRIGELTAKTDLKSLAKTIKKKFGLESLKFAGNPDLSITKAAICSGSGSSIMKNFFSSGAQVYISGDLRYHDAKDIQAAGLGLIDIGHFSSEHLIIDSIGDRLNNILLEKGLNVNIKACQFEADPFKTIT